MQRANFTPIVAYAIRTSGPWQMSSVGELNKESWHYSRFTPFVEELYKGQLVFERGDVQAQADQDSK